MEYKNISTCIEELIGRGQLIFEDRKEAAKLKLNEGLAKRLEGALDALLKENKINN